MAQDQHILTAVIVDSVRRPIEFVSVKIITTFDTLFVITGNDGKIRQGLGPTMNLTIELSHTSYQIKQIRLKPKGTQDFNLGEIVLIERITYLDEVVIKAPELVIIKDDTIEYNVEDLEMKENDVAEDLLKKLPGLSVDRKGFITANGVLVNRVRVNGKEFFNGEVQTATQNLSAEDVATIQVIDDYGVEARMSGLKDREPDKVLNINLKKKKIFGFFGHAEGSVGNEKRKSASLSSNYFDDKNQLAVSAGSNNVNGDIASQVKPFTKSYGSGPSKLGVNSLTESTVTHRATLPNNLNVNSLYGYNENRQTLSTEQVSSSAFDNEVILKTETSESHERLLTHRFDFHIDYAKTPSLYTEININASSNSTTNKRESNQDLTVKGNDLTKVDGSSYTDATGAGQALNAQTLILYSLKNGSAVSFNGDISYDRSDQELSSIMTYRQRNPLDYDTTIRQRITEVTHGGQYNIRASYSSPFNEYSVIEGEIKVSGQSRSNQISHYQLGKDEMETKIGSLSNAMKLATPTHNIATKYQFNKDKIRVLLAIGLQRNILKIHSVEDDTDYMWEETSWMPQFQSTYKFTGTRSISLSVNTLVITPTFTQLQPVLNSSNPIFVSEGNPNLGAEQHFLINAIYNSLNIKRGDTFVANVTAVPVKNKIISTLSNKRVDEHSVALQKQGTANASGFYRISLSYGYNKNIFERKIMAFINGSFDYNNNITRINNDLVKNPIQIWKQAGGIKLSFEKFSGDILTEYTSSRMSNNINASISNDINTLRIECIADYDLGKTVTVGASFNKIYNHGFQSHNLSNPFVINSFLEFKLIKNTLSLQAQAYDILNQNISFARILTSNGTVDSMTDRLSRYYFVSAIYKFRK